MFLFSLTYALLRVDGFSFSGKAMQKCGFFRIQPSLSSSVFGPKLPSLGPSVLIASLDRYCVLQRRGWSWGCNQVVYSCSLGHSTHRFWGLELTGHDPCLLLARRIRGVFPNGSSE